MSPTSSSILLASAGKGQVLTGQIPADLFIDCRGIHNPFRDPVLGGKTGDDPLLQEWILENNGDYVQAAKDMILTAHATLPTRGGGAGKAGPLKVCFFCLAGVHRSRGMKHVLGTILTNLGYSVEVI